MTIRRTLLGTAILAGAAIAGPWARSVHAQVRVGEFQVAPQLGVAFYDNASPFEDAGFIGATAQYFLTKNVKIGIAVDVARPEVDGSYFPNVLFNFGGDTTVMQRVGQQVTQLTYGVFLGGTATSGRWVGGVKGGVGATTFLLDPQVMLDNVSFTDLAFSLGGSLNIALTQAAGVQFEVQDVIVTGFDREQFNPVIRDTFKNTLFPEANGNPPPPKSTIHNVRLVLAFEFYPGLGL